MSTTSIPAEKRSWLATAYPKYHPISLLEILLGTILYRMRAHDKALFTRNPLFASHPEPSIPLESPELSPSPVTLLPKHWFLSTNEFPTLTWTLPSSLEGKVKEFLLVVEDPDAPPAQPPVHGIFYGIPADRRAVSNEDLGKMDGLMLTGGFKRGRTQQGMVYIGPRPPMGHGVHRYIYQLVALGKPLKVKGEEGEGVTRKEVVKACEGKVVGWGVWVGTFESKW